jgi:protein involved in polysaccharide export with SLBB domain
MRSNETLLDLLEKAGGMTREAYVFGAGLYREEIKKTQTENLDKLLRRLETESAASLAQLSQSMGASTDASILQARLLAGPAGTKASD